MLTLESVNMSQRHADLSEEEDTIEFQIGKLKSRLPHLKKSLDETERELERGERIVEYGVRIVSTLRRDIEACEKKLSRLESRAFVHKDLKKELERAKMTQ